MYKLSFGQTFEATVIVNDPTFEVPPQFTAVFAVMTDTQINSLMKSEKPWLDTSSAKQIVESMSESEQTNFAKAILRGWGNDIGDENGAWAYTPENVDKALSLPFVRMAIGQTFLQKMSGVLTKNSTTSPADSPEAS